MSNWGERTCFSVGMSGGCGYDCPVLLSGNCENVGEFDMKSAIEYYGKEEAMEILSNYSEFEEIIENLQFDDYIRGMLED